MFSGGVCVWGLLIKTSRSASVEFSSLPFITLKVTFFPKYYPTSWTSSFTSFRPWNPGILGWHRGVLYVPHCSFFRNMAGQVSSLHSDWPGPALFSMWLCRSLCCGPEWGQPARRSEVEKVPWVMSQDCQLSVLPRHCWMLSWESSQIMSGCPVFVICLCWPNLPAGQLVF